LPNPSGRTRPWSLLCRVAHIHGNDRVDLEMSAAVLDRLKRTVVSVDAVSRTALNVRVDLEGSAVILDRMKRTVVSVDAVSRTALNVRVDLERSAVVLDRMRRTVVSVDAVSRTRTECLRWPCEVQSWLRPD
jgi:hypothetical protein